eukprot:m.186784 g.186784  ORF g.186784 m.186784 type:complete len:68 (+) comp25603_c0_seq2:948-1151(+)
MYAQQCAAEFFYFSNTAFYLKPTKSRTCKVRNHVNCFGFVVEAKDRQQTERYRTANNTTTTIQRQRL